MQWAMPPQIRALEWILAIALCAILTLIEAYFAYGLFLAPMDGYADLVPGTTFSEPTAVVDWPVRIALLTALAGSAIATPLTVIRSPWAFAAILVHFAAGKTVWIRSAFLPGYDSSLIGAWMTVLQVLAMGLVFRATDTIRIWRRIL